MARYLTALLITMFIIPLLAGEEKIIRGTVSDASTGEPLSAANLEIEGSYRGTITNTDGRFILDVSEIPSYISISYIGYRSARIMVDSNSPEQLRIDLQPVTYELEPVLVTDEDPAVNIMRKVIKKKQEWRAKLSTYIVSAYSRGIIENDAGIVAISESTSEVYWDKERGSREVVNSRRQTSNIGTDENFAFASFNANFYDDDIEMMGFRIIGPTHPDALKHYRFRLVDRRYRDDQTVYDIEVLPAGKLQPTLQGRISVLDEAYAIIDIDLRPSPSILFPPPIQEFNLSYQQQFSNFGQEFWLPLDMRTQGTIKIGIVGLSFPPFGYQRIARFNAYQVNVPLPDSLYKNGRMIFADSATVAKDTLLASIAGTVPLSSRETDAYRDIDTSKTINRAFKPTGPLARFIDTDEQSQGTNSTPGFFSRYLSPTPALWYNRVEGAYAGLKLSNTNNSWASLSGGAGYGFDLRRWHLNAETEIFLSQSRSFSVQAGYFRGSATQYSSPTYHRTMVGIRTFFGADDYFDYYWEEGISSGLKFRRPEWNTELSVTFNSEDHRSLSRRTEYAIFNPGNTQRQNPSIDSGLLRSISGSIDIGDDYIPLGLVGQNRFSLSIEHSTPSVLGSDFDFTRVDVALDLKISTFLRRRIMPNALNIRITAGTSRGSLPLQRFGSIDGSLGVLKPFGVMRTRVGLPYQGEKYAAIFWEHNFQTVPFEMAGLGFLARRGIGVILHGASGRTWIDRNRLESLEFSAHYQNRFHHELGLSINNLLGLLRLDLTQRLDNSGFYVGFGLARFF